MLKNVLLLCFKTNSNLETQVIPLMISNGDKNERSETLARGQ